ncbi:MAG: hypothetical protein ACSLEN_14290 [Candidatus Malihini olakiniferum]
MTFILERDFEHGLRFCRVDNIDELNRLARLWRMKFNRTAINSFYGMTRTDKYLIKKGIARYVSFGFGSNGRFRQGVFEHLGCRVILSESLH